MDQKRASSWIRRFSPLIPKGGRVLDLACGEGRHSRYLAGLGYAVEAVDRNAAMLDVLSATPGVRTRVADLEAGEWPFQGLRFAGIIVTCYLHRPLLPVLAAALDDEGILLYETFMAGNERFGKPANLEFLLQPDELLEYAKDAGLNIVAFEQGVVAMPRPAVMQRLCAARGKRPNLPE